MPARALKSVVFPVLGLPTRATVCVRVIAMPESLIEIEFQSTDSLIIQDELAIAYKKRGDGDRRSVSSVQRLPKPNDSTPPRGRTMRFRFTLLALLFAAIPLRAQDAAVKALIDKSIAAEIGDLE